MDLLPVCFILMAIFVVHATFAANDRPPSADIINVPDPNSFNDRSALENEQNLQSQQYQDFIHTLYRYDKDNLKRVDHLFERVGDYSSSSGNVNGAIDVSGGGGGGGGYGYSDGVSDDELHQPSYADYIKSQPNNFIGISQQLSSKRFKRSAQGAIFRPLFVYRIFQEKVREREEKRLHQQQLQKEQEQRKRLLAERRHTSPYYLCNEFDHKHTDYEG